MHLSLVAAAVVVEVAAPTCCLVQLGTLFVVAEALAAAAGAAIAAVVVAAWLVDLVEARSPCLDSMLEYRQQSLSTNWLLPEDRRFQDLMAKRLVDVACCRN